MPEDKPETITVNFNRHFITAAGKIKQVEITQANGQGTLAVLQLTKEQAQSLASELTRKLGNV